MRTLGLVIIVIWLSGCVNSTPQVICAEGNCLSTGTTLPPSTIPQQSNDQRFQISAGYQRAANSGAGIILKGRIGVSVKGSVASGNGIQLKIRK